jgi:hypothetical protein
VRAGLSFPGEYTMSRPVFREPASPVTNTDPDAFTAKEIEEVRLCKPL